DQGALSFHVLLDRGLSRQQQLLLGLGDRILGCLNFFVLRAGDDLLHACLIGLELLARGVNLRLGGLALRVERAVLSSSQPRLGDIQVVLRGGQLAEGLIVLSLELGTLRLYAAVGQRVEPSSGRFDQGLGAGDLRLDGSLAGGRPAALQQAELALSRFYRRITRLHRGTGRRLGLTAGGAVGRLRREAQGRRAQAGRFLLERRLVRFRRGLLGLRRLNSGLGLCDRGLRRIVGLVQRCLSGPQRRLRLIERGLRRLDVGRARPGLIVESSIGGGNRGSRGI